MRGGTRSSRHELVLQSGPLHDRVVDVMSSQHRSRGAVAPFGRSNRFDEIDNYSYRYDSRKSPGPVYSSCTSLNSTFNKQSTLMTNSSELRRRPHDTTPHRDTSHVSESRVQDLRRKLSDRRVLIELESKRMWASRGDRYAVATLPSFRSAIIMSNIDANPAEIDALYESFPSHSTWYSIISTLRRESKQDRPKTTCSSASRCGSRRGNDLRPKVPFLISSKEGARSKIGSLLKFSHSK